jgi:hypothetical protein
MPDGQMTAGEQIRLWYQEWKETDPNESGDDYYWHGASDFLEFLVAKLEPPPVSK